MSLYETLKSVSFHKHVVRCVIAKLKTIESDRVESFIQQKRNELILLYRVQLTIKRGWNE